MAVRQIILDTETTGLRPEDGHRIIEIGCIEMIDRKRTGEHFHQYINPEREVDPGALQVHGISNEFLQDKPLFSEIVSDFIRFVEGAEIIIHNAPFDLSFLNHELRLMGNPWKAFTHYCRITDTLAMARSVHVGQRNSLDALCKRYQVDNAKRDLHGALLDADLLAQVYLAMTGGQSSMFEPQHESKASPLLAESVTFAPVDKYQLTVVRADDQELEQHEKYKEMLKSKGNCLWDAE